MTTTIDITTPAFARRLAALLSVHRGHTKASIRSLARRSNGLVTAKVLHEIEAGHYPLDGDLVSVVAALYGADLESILPDRMIVSVSPDGMVTAGPVAQKFDPSDENALLVAYLRLVRSLRGEQRAESLVLRRDDVEVLAGYLHLPGTVVLERLLSLMGSTRAQRSAVMALFATGAMVVGLSSGAAAFSGDAGPTPAAASPSTTAAVVVVDAAPSTTLDVVEVAVPESVAVDTPQVDVGDAAVPLPVEAPAPEVVDPVTVVSMPQTAAPAAPSIVAPSDPAADVASDGTPLPDGSDPSSATSAPEPDAADPLPIPIGGSVLPSLPDDVGVTDAPVPVGAPADTGPEVSGGDVVTPPGAPPIVAPLPQPAPVALGDDVVVVVDAGA